MTEFPDLKAEEIDKYLTLIRQISGNNSEYALTAKLTPFQDCPQLKEFLEAHVYLLQNGVPLRPLLYGIFTSAYFAGHTHGRESQGILDLEKMVGL